MMELQDLLKKLTAAFGPSGCEGEVRGVIEELIAPYVDECTTDTLGNLIAHKKGPGKKLMFSAHMDSIGMIVTHVEKEGFLRFGSLGWLPALDIRRQSVVFQNGLRGTISLPEDKEEDKEIKQDDLCIDIGAGSREEALALVKLGDACVYDAPPTSRTVKFSPSTWTTGLAAPPDRRPGPDSEPRQRPLVCLFPPRRRWAYGAPSPPPTGWTRMWASLWM